MILTYTLKKYKYIVKRLNESFILNVMQVVIYWRFINH